MPAKLFIALLVLVALTLGGNAMYVRGYSTRDALAKRDEAAIRADALDKYGKVAALALQRERALQDALDRETAQRQKENTDHEKTLSMYRARARAGDERLRADVADCSVPGTATPAGTGFAARPGGETRAYLVPAITDDVLRLASDSARLVRDYNAVVDAYERARQTCNAGVTP